MGGWLAGLGQGAQGILGQRAANEKAVADEQDRGAILAQRAAELAQTQAQAQIEQQKLRMQQQTAAQQQAVIDDIRKRNLMVNYGGQQIPLADVLASGMGPKDFAPPAQNIKMWKGGTAAAPREMATDFSTGTTTDLGAAPAATGTSPAAKFGESAIGALPGGAIPTDINGNPIDANPLTPLNEVPGVAAIFSPKNMDLFQANAKAVRDLQKISDAAVGVLPDKTAATTGEFARDYMEGWARPVLASVGAPKYATFQESKAGVIPYMRGLTGAARVNQNEFQATVDRINKANTLPDLQAAVKEAQNIVQEGQKGLIRAGRINTGGAAPAESGGSGGWSTPVQKRDASGKLVWMQNNGKTWRVLGPVS